MPDACIEDLAVHQQFPVLYILPCPPEQGSTNPKDLIFPQRVALGMSKPEHKQYFPGGIQQAAVSSKILAQR
ncbi:hypothetical protein PanWU01x14_054500 [Parasponia andersonii]|uniref:Uncharacterized protein n=1 Tax=Parasponia andersonii TaxID=3476 RepID=A0A2P5DKT6_PARAD|nr:hypothetical protein PanWU01x14_054500 [Parasponia andersonii]